MLGTILICTYNVAVSCLKYRLCSKYLIWWCKLHDVYSSVHYDPSAWLCSHFRMYPGTWRSKTRVATVFFYLLITGLVLFYLTGNFVIQIVHMPNVCCSDARIETSFLIWPYFVVGLLPFFYFFIFCTTTLAWPFCLPEMRLMRFFQSECIKTTYFCRFKAGILSDSGLTWGATATKQTILYWENQQPQPQLRQN